MKIMFNISNLAKGGAERVISVLSNNLIDRYEVTILINDAKNIGYTLDNNIKIIQLDDKREKNPIKRNIKRIKDTERILREEKPDIIISFLPMPSYRILYANRNIKIPIIISDRNDPKQEYKPIVYKLLMKWLYKKADGFVFQTSEQKEYFSKKIKENSTIIFNPIKEEFLRENDKKYEERKDAIISVGRLVEQKNQKMLIDAFSKVVKKYPEFQLKIFGTGHLEKELQEQIEKLKIKDKVLLCGTTNDIKTELLNAKIFTMPSNYEGMPNALIEAMASGCAVISTDCPCGGPRELIENGKNGILIQVGNENEMEKSMCKLIENKEYSEKIGQNAKKIKEKLAPKYIVEQWEKYINYVIEEREK